MVRMSARWPAPGLLIVNKASDTCFVIRASFNAGWSSGCKHRMGNSWISTPREHFRAQDLPSWLFVKASRELTARKRVDVKANVAALRAREHFSGGLDCCSRVS